MIMDWLRYYVSTLYVHGDINQKNGRGYQCHHRCFPCPLDEEDPDQPKIPSNDARAMCVC